MPKRSTVGADLTASMAFDQGFAPPELYERDGSPNGELLDHTAAMERDIALLWTDEKLNLEEISTYIHQEYGMIPSSRAILQALSIDLQTQIVQCAAILNMPTGDIQSYLAQVLRYPLATREIEKIILEFRAHIIYLGIFQQLSPGEIACRVQDEFRILVSETYIDDTLQEHRREFHRSHYSSVASSSTLESAESIYGDERRDSPSLHVPPLKMNEKALE